ncbi:LacI family DNA-binding transcriptional regulator [Klebsiella pneumoniae subsp. pneumoniae]|nr:LacI family DNA-binding transcriptional regulator [Klebsiella pneumoniae subsp. pneumoniae]
MIFGAVFAVIARFLIHKWSGELTPRQDKTFYHFFSAIKITYSSDNKVYKDRTMIKRFIDRQGSQPAGYGNRKKITINDVALAAGVSVSTVSLVLSGKGRISSATGERG